MSEQKPNIPIEQTHQEPPTEHDYSAEIVAPEGMSDVVPVSKFGVSSLKRLLGFSKHKGSPSEAGDIEPTNLDVSEPTATPEAASAPVSETYKYFSALIGNKHTPTVVSYENSLQEDEASQTHFAELDDLSAQTDALNVELRETQGGYSEEKKVYAKIDTVKAKIAAFGEDALSRWRHTTYQKEQLKKGKLVLDKNTPLAQTLLSVVTKTTQGQYDKSYKEHAPFKDYLTNTDQSWQYVPDEKVKNFLQTIKFVSTDGAEQHSKGLKAVITSGKNDVIELPSNLFISAAGFDSWLGRGYKGRNTKQVDSKYGGFKSQSINAIKHYAGMPTKLPPIGEARIFIQPDGKVFCDNGSGDSHRIAAAFLRGQETIEADKATVMVLDKNYIN